MVITLKIIRKKMVELFRGRLLKEFEYGFS